MADCNNNDYTLNNNTVYSTTTSSTDLVMSCFMSLGQTSQIPTLEPEDIMEHFDSIQMDTAPRPSSPQDMMGEFFVPADSGRTWTDLTHTWPAAPSTSTLGYEPSTSYSDGLTPAHHQLPPFVDLHHYDGLPSPSSGAEAYCLQCHSLGSTCCCVGSGMDWGEPVWESPLDTCIPDNVLVDRSDFVPDYRAREYSDWNLANIPKKKRERRCLKLWQYLLQLLADPEHYSDMVRWEFPQRGIFAFIDTRQTALSWGQKKKKKEMSYENLARALRHYYKPGIMRRVPGKRLVYQFGPNASGWRETLQKPVC